MHFHDHDAPTTRHRFLNAFGLATIGLSVLGAAQGRGAAHTTTNITAAEALERLRQGNERYRSDSALNCNMHYERRAEVAGYQHPFAMVLGCADSRVPPEIIFDQRLGDMFTVRIAGNIADSNAIGSLEYAVLHFGSPLLMVLGHERCGAVNATLEVVEKHASAPSHIASLVSAIKPAVESALGEPGDKLENAIRANVKHVVSGLHSSSTVLADSVAKGKLRIVGALYGLTDGRVRVLA
jgi:carbonic anhydrase